MVPRVAATLSDARDGAWRYRKTALSADDA